MPAGRRLHLLYKTHQLWHTLSPSLCVQEFVFRRGDTAECLYFVVSGIALETQTLDYSTDLSRSEASKTVDAVHRRVR